MKKIITSNDTLLEILTENGINLECDENMDIVIPDEDARKVADIIEEYAPAAEFDYMIENVNKLADILDMVEGAELRKTFSYEVDAKRWFFIVQTSQAPGAEVMKELYDMNMRVSYELYASADRGRYTMYVINHKEEIDYEWTDETPLI